MVIIIIIIIIITHLVHHHLPELHVIHPDHFACADDKQQRTRGIELDLRRRDPSKLAENIPKFTIVSVSQESPEQVILKKEAGLVAGLPCVEAVHQEAAVPAAGGQEAAIT